LKAVGSKREDRVAEQQILSILNHPFLVRLHYWFEDDEANMYLVLDYVAGGELSLQLHK
jgi:serine/threonine protein kinase